MEGQDSLPAPLLEKDELRRLLETGHPDFKPTATGQGRPKVGLGCALGVPLSVWLFKPGTRSLFPKLLPEFVSVPRGF